MLHNPTGESEFKNLRMAWVHMTAMFPARMEGTPGLAPEEEFGSWSVPPDPVSGSPAAAVTSGSPDSASFLPSNGRWPAMIDMSSPPVPQRERAFLRTRARMSLQSDGVTTSEVASCGCELGPSEPPRMLGCRRRRPNCSSRLRSGDLAPSRSRLSSTETFPACR